MASGGVPSGGADVGAPNGAAGGSAPGGDKRAVTTEDGVRKKTKKRGGKDGAFGAVAPTEKGPQVPWQFTENIKQLFSIYTNDEGERVGLCRVCLSPHEYKLTATGYTNMIAHLNSDKHAEVRSLACCMLFWEQRSSSERTCESYS